MLSQGLVEEVRALLSAGVSPSSTALQAIGYKELLGALRGEKSLAEATEEIKLRSRQYAKRQLTWLRRNKAIHWIFWKKERDFPRAPSAFDRNPLRPWIRISLTGEERAHAHRLYIEKALCGKRRQSDMQKAPINFQDTFLAKTRRAGTLVTVFLMNGFQMHGVISGYDSFVVVLDSDGKQQMIYKHAISTIIPMRPIDFNATGD